MTTYLEHRRALKLGQLPPPKKPKKKIRPFSKKREKINREYAKKTKPLWEGLDCEARTPDCIFSAQGMHHLEGKETTEKLLNTKKMIRCCNPCNAWIEKHDAEARMLGLKKSKMKTKRFDK